MLTLLLDIEMDAVSPALTRKSTGLCQAIRLPQIHGSEVPSLGTKYCERDITECSDQAESLGGISPLDLPESVLGAKERGQRGIPSPAKHAFTASDLRFKLSILEAGRSDEHSPFAK